MFFFNDTATTEIYTLSLHDALPIYDLQRLLAGVRLGHQQGVGVHAELLRVLGVQRVLGVDERRDAAGALDRKSTRLNSSHANISYAVFCLKKITTTQNYSYIHYHSL